MPRNYLFGTRDEKPIIIVLFLILVGLIFVRSFFSPDHIEIYQSYSTGECVAMIVYSPENPNGLRQECPEELPRHYSHTWVK
jgi:hypothetical protein